MNKDALNKFYLLAENITDKEDLIEETVKFLKKELTIDAVGLRLKEHGDFPYYTTIGFSSHFIKLENFLAKKDKNGATVRGENGQPILECMCGDILNGKYDSSRPFYTKSGSFFMGEGSTKELNDTVKFMNCMVRGKCMQEGYKSVAIIPIPYNNKNIGLIQLNSIKVNAFDISIIEIVEQIAFTIGKSIGKFICEEEERIVKKEKMKENLKAIVSDILVTLNQMSNKKPGN